LEIFTGAKTPIWALAQTLSLSLHAYATITDITHY